jgi:hypothetical protein
MNIQNRFAAFLIALTFAGCINATSTQKFLKTDYAGVYRIAITPTSVEGSTLCQAALLIDGEFDVTVEDGTVFFNIGPGLVGLISDDGKFDVSGEQTENNILYQWGMIGAFTDDGHTVTGIAATLNVTASYPGLSCGWTYDVSGERVN